MTETFELDSAEAKEAAKQLHLGCFVDPVVNGSMVNPPIDISGQISSRPHTTDFPQMVV